MLLGHFYVNSCIKACSSTWHDDAVTSLPVCQENAVLLRRWCLSSSASDIVSSLVGGVLRSQCHGQGCCVRGGLGRPSELAVNSSSLAVEIFSLSL